MNESPTTNPLDAPISQGFVTTNSVSQTTAAAFIGQVRSGAWAGNVTQVRQKKAQAAALRAQAAARLAAGAPAEAAQLKAQAEAVEAEAAKLKKSLPAAILAGTFSQAGNKFLLEASGLVCLDLDHLSDAEACKAGLVGDPHVAAAFISPSGDGLKVVLCAPKATSAEDYTTRVYPSVTHYFTTRYEVDAGVLDDLEDVSRRCYISHDPDPLVNYSAVPVPEITPLAPQPAAPGATSTKTTYLGALSACSDFDDRGDVPALLRAHGWSSSNDAEWTRPHGPGECPSPKSAELGGLDKHPRSLWVFSTSAAPLEAGRGYFPHQLFAALYHGGDIAATEAALQALGYGRKPEVPDTAPAAPGVMPVAILSGPGFTNTQAAAGLFKILAPTGQFFLRGGVVHEVAPGGDGGSMLVPVPARAFRTRIERHAQLHAYRSDRGKGEGTGPKTKLVPALCSEDLAATFLAAKEIELLPPVRSVVSLPPLVIGQDGKPVMLKPGYNPEVGGVYVTSNTIAESVPLPVAVEHLLDLLGDFDFASGGDASRAVASLITPALKMGGILTERTPIEIVEANESQTGKGFMRRLVHRLYGETPSRVTQQAGGVGSPEERINENLLRGRTFIEFDNFVGRLSLPHLDTILTEDTITCRVPYRGSVPVDPRPFVFGLTSNGVELSRDLSNRASFVRLKKQPEGYAFRRYPEGDLLDHVEKNRAHYLGCVYAVVKAWIAQGCKEVDNPRHDFRRWAGILGWVVEHVFGMPPLMEGHDALKTRASDSGAAWLRALCLAVEAEGRLGEAVTPKGIALLYDDRDLEIPGAHPEQEPEARAQPVGRHLRRLFKGESVILREGYAIERTPVPPSAETYWKEAWRYTFTKAPA